MLSKYCRNPEGLRPGGVRKASWKRGSLDCVSKGDGNVPHWDGYARTEVLKGQVSRNEEFGVAEAWAA